MSVSDRLSSQDVVRLLRSTGATGWPVFRENGLLVEVIPVSIYVDPRGRRIVEIESDHEPMATTGTSQPGSPKAVTVGGKRVTVSDLMDAGLLQPAEFVDFIRPVWDITTPQ